MTDEKDELKDIKSLIVLLLQKLEVSNAKIGKALGINEGNVSKLLDKKKYKNRRKK